MNKLFLLLFLTLGCFTANSAGFPVTINSCGKPVTFERPPQRAIIHDINMAEMAFALKLQNRIIGLTGITGWYKMTPEFTQEMDNIPELAPKYPSLETILSANPDFFFAGWNYGMQVGGDVTPEKLEQYGIPTFVLSESCLFASTQPGKASMDLLYNDQITLGKIFGKEKEAKRLVEEWKYKLLTLPKPPEGSRPAKVFVYDSGKDKPFTSGKYAMPTAIIEAAGGKNIMDSLEASWTSSTWETVSVAEPDFIILLDYQTGSGAESLQHFLESHPLMKLTPAVKQGKYLKLQYAELTPGPANIKAIEKLANALYAGEKS
ncbi:ABC transporter substrate-binding protein [Serratia sp. UGAL515B_01]|uniref:ABC transporter substrate-binding protein n=1 Tax=Serratia sp. UGAL515B_01 TaxID=2986763 RepID=UPI0029542A53|nr:ABC transporter substrate-binding protein [Serratia sp. UGAL515B_01]WON77708.1 ABC transporter substrate-binding protein [Serratia sp. UGAL515B_01]